MRKTKEKTRPTELNFTERLKQKQKELEEQDVKYTNLVWDGKKQDFIVE